MCNRYDSTIQLFWLNVSIIIVVVVLVIILQATLKGEIPS